MTEKREVMLSILIPVRNEPECISIIVRVLEALVDVPHELLVVTDEPDDSTVPVIHSMSRKFTNVKHVENKLGRGVLNAVRAGVDAAQGKYVMIYAADEIGPVLAIPKMIELMEGGCDFVSGTRYAKGGKRYGGSLTGHILSRTANALFNFFTATALSDCTTGLKIFRRDLFHKFDFSSAGSGWSFAFDMAIAAQVMKLRIGEVPIVSIDRLFGGVSSMRLIPWIRSYIRCFIKGLRALPPYFWGGRSVFASLSVGFFFIWWILHNVEMEEVKALSTRVNPYFIVAAMAFYGTAIILRIYRWKKLLFPFAALSFWQVGRALIAGYAMNIILPARLGELFRVNICKAWYSVPRSAALASVVWERVSDGIIVVSCLMVGVFSLSTMQGQREIQGLLIGGVCIFASAVSILLLLRKISLARLLCKWPSLLTRAQIFQKGVQDLPLSALAQMMGLAGVIWIFEGLSLWSIVNASGATLTVMNTCLLIGVVSLSTLLPSPPGFLGTMQFAFAIALLAAGHATAVGVLAATMTQLFLLGSLTLFGILLYSWISLKNRKLNLRNL